MCIIIKGLHTSLSVTGPGFPPLPIMSNQHYTQPLSLVSFTESQCDDKPKLDGYSKSIIGVVVYNMNQSWYTLDEVYDELKRLQQRTDNWYYLFKEKEGNVTTEICFAQIRAHSTA